MSLSNKLVSDFVKITNSTSDTKKETTVYGTVLSNDDDRMIVQIDGFDGSTPVVTTVDAKVGERVSVLIKDHTATVTGNSSSPSARTDDLQETNAAVSTIKQNMSNVAELVEEARQAASNAQDQANLATEYANNAKQAADNAEDRAELVEQNMAGVIEEVDSVKEDAIKLRSDMETEIDTVRTEISTTYATKDEVSTTESTLRKEIEDSVAGVTTTFEQDYAKKTDVEDAIVGVKENLQTQITHNADTISSTAKSVESIQVEVTDQNGKISDALNAANEAEMLATNAKTSAENAKTAADEAKANLAIAEENLTKLKNRTDATEADIAAAQVAVDAAQKAVDKAQLAATNAQKAAENAQASADEAKEDISALNERMTTAETKIEQNSEAIALCATKEEVENVDGKFDNYYTKTETDAKFKITSESIEAEFTKTNSRFDKYYTKTETDAKIEIDGANLLPNTHGEEVTYSYPPSGYVDKWKQKVSSPLNGDTYTLSFWAKSSVDGDKIEVRLSEADKVTGLKGSQGQKFSAEDGHCVFTLTTTMTKYWVTYTIEKNSGARPYVILPSLSKAYFGDTVTISKEKFEQGTAATDWTPATEDYYTKTETDAKFAMTDKSIKSTVTKTNELATRVSTVEQTAEEVSVELSNMEIGGVNLLPNTYSEEVPFLYPASGYVDKWQQKVSSPLNGDTYTLSFWAKSSVDGDKIQVYLYNPPIVTGLKGSQGQTFSTADGYCVFTLTTTMTKYWVTYTIQKNSGARPYVILPRLSASYGSGTVIISKAKFERGTMTTDWTPAIEEVDADISKAAKTATSYLSYTAADGLQVGNKTSGTWSGSRAQILPDSFNILNAEGKRLASYGDDTISIGSENDSVVIKLGGNRGTIEHHPKGTTEYSQDGHEMEMWSHNLTLHGTNRARITTRSYHGDSDEFSIPEIELIDERAEIRMQGRRITFNGCMLRPMHIDMGNESDRGNPAGWATITATFHHPYFGTPFINVMHNKLTSTENIMFDHFVVSPYNSNCITGFVYQVYAPNSSWWEYDTVWFSIGETYM